MQETIRLQGVCDRIKGARGKQSRYADKSEVHLLKTFLCQNCGDGRSRKSHEG